MEVHIYSVKAKSQAGNMWVKHIMTTQKDQTERKPAREFTHFAGNSAEVRGFRRERC